MLVEQENKEERAVWRHPDSRRLGPPAFPHREPPGVSQNLERGKEGCVGGGEGQLEHWQLLKRFPGAGGKDGGVAVEVVGKDGEDSGKSLMVEIPFLDEMVKVADSPASSNSSNK